MCPVAVLEGGGDTEWIILVKYSIRKKKTKRKRCNKVMVVASVT